MKSKKPFLIVCAAALTLSVVLPFMGVFAFAESTVTLYTGSNSAFGDYFFKVGYAGAFSLETVQQNSSFIYDTSHSYYYIVVTNSSSSLYRTITYDGVAISDSSSSNPFVVPYPYDGVFNFTASSSSDIADKRVYFVLGPAPEPPDPLAPVSDGMDTMISVFGDVIDYIINTPDVAIFVAISVASCAIIPMGIILIKKLIKGY